MYRLLSIGPISAYCGVPGIHLGSVTSMSIPAFVRFSTGASSHILIKCSMAPLTIR